MSHGLTRRGLLVAGAAIPATIATAAPIFAKAPMQGATQASFNRIKLGAFEVTTLLAGSRVVEGPQGIFGLNVSEEEFAQVSAQNFLPTDKSQFFFNPTIINTGAELVLFDTGLNAEGITGALTAAGYTPEQVDKVVITHMHGDHIGGLRNDTGDTFPNAEYITGQVEYDAWAGQDNDGFNASVRPLADKMRFIADGDTVASGITAVAAFGHTPGHMTYRIESEGKQVHLIADLANHYVWSLAYPDWEVRFDMDKAAAAQARRNVLGMLAADRVAFIGYHMPFPGVGYVETRDDGFRYVPASYQFAL